MKIIDILGLGESLSKYNNERKNLTIGVNDIYKYYKTDCIVLCDPKRRFEPDRLKTIEESNPIFFFSEYTEWFRKDKKTTFIKIERSNIASLNDKQIWNSNTSTFVACVIAYKFFYPTEINVFGLDLLTHPTLSQPGNFQKAVNDFKKLKQQLNEKGVKFNSWGLHI